MAFETKDIIASTLSLTALLISVFTFALNYRYTHRSSILNRKPVLIFEYDGACGWVVRNIGGGPALNVVVAQKRVGGPWFNPVRIPPLAKDGKFLLVWLGHVNSTGLGATYSDTENLPYTSTCGNDLSRTEKGYGFGPWPESEIGRHWKHPVFVG